MMKSGLGSNTSLKSPAQLLAATTQLVTEPASTLGKRLDRTQSRERESKERQSREMPKRDR